MSIISSRQKLLFCEGQPESFDYAILKRLVNTSEVVIPAGGKYGLGAFIQGRLSTYQNQLPLYLAFRDRDFDANPTLAVQLISHVGWANVCLPTKSLWWATKNPLPPT